MIKSGEGWRVSERDGQWQHCLFHQQSATHCTQRTPPGEGASKWLCLLLTYEAAGEELLSLEPGLDTQVKGGQAKHCRGKGGIVPAIQVVAMGGHKGGHVRGKVQKGVVQDGEEGSGLPSLETPRGHGEVVGH